MERCTGRLVDCKKEEIFIITYCATGRRSLGRHTDGDGKRTLLITLDASRDYAGGGTRFYPKEASAPSFVVRCVEINQWHGCLKFDFHTGRAPGPRGRCRVRRIC